MLRRAALRTWLGRLGYNHFPRDSHMTIPKDHEFSRRLLEHHIAHARALEGTPRERRCDAGRSASPTCRAGRGARWLAEAFRLFRAQPLAWIGAVRWAGS